MFKKISKIKITVDKSHIFTLGEKMYRESIEFIRELVNNAYDADASEVYVMVGEDKITIEDNGSGLDEKRLEQFFTIGSEEKKIKSISPRFGRKRIGQFGIGKFSALSLANQFIVQSVRGRNSYAVIFDRADWQNSNNWELPVKKERATPLDKEGTKIILNKLTKNISPAEIEKYLKQSVPLRAKKFQVYLNNKKITATVIAGRIIPIKIKTIYGLIEGEIIVALNPASSDEPGIECRVKQVFIKREFFGLDKKYHQGLTRIYGSVNADFLPLLSSRSDFIADDAKYKLFYQLMRAELDKVLRDLKKQNDLKNIKKITKELQQIMKQLKEALALNPDFIPQGKAITRLKKEGRKNITASADFANKSQTDFSKDPEKNKTEKEAEKTKNAEIKQPALEAKPLVIKRIRLKKLGIACGIVNLGEDGPEVISQGNTVYINQDHPLYQKLYKKRELLSLHLLRLITQEVVLMKKLHIASREAFAWQGKLLKDAICEK